MPKTPPPKELTLAGLHDGAALEMFENALAQVLENITDLNTDHKEKREIRLTFQFTTNDERNVTDVVVKAATKLAGIKGVQSLVYIGKHEGRTVAVEQPRQEDLFPQPSQMEADSPFNRDK
jgi:cell division protein FtsX